MNLFGNQNILSKDGEVLFFPNFFSKSESDDYLDSLTNEIDWRHEAIKMFGKEVMQPRLTAYFADNGKHYKYSGIVMQAESWNAVLKAIKSMVEVQSGVAFNAALLNYYRNGKDSMGWHSDDEKELGLNPVIASVSFGASRNFQFRNKLNKSVKASVELNHGSLLLMQGNTQHYWQHQIPKTQQIIGARINITFRQIL